MTDHDPSAVKVLRNLTDLEVLANRANILDALTAAGLAVVQVGEVPPWMVRMTARELTHSVEQDHNGHYECCGSVDLEWHDDDEAPFVIDPEWTP